MLHTFGVQVGLIRFGFSTGVQALNVEMLNPEPYLEVHG